MRFPLACLPLVLVSGSLLAADDRSDFQWIQVQGGITDHRTKNPDHQQPAFGFGVGSWVNGHVGFEASGLFTHVNYGYPSSREAHATASLLINPFRTPSTVRPFLRLGVGGTAIGEPISGTGSTTTRLSGTVGLGLQLLMGDRGFASLEGRLVQIESQVSRKEGQALAGIGMRWGNRKPAPAAYVPPPPVVEVRVEAPQPPPQVIVVTTPPPPPEVIYVPAPVVPRKIILEEATLHFANGKAILSTEGRAAVNTVAAELKELKAPFQVVVSGHTSKVGRAAFNLQLSKDRAAAVAKVLVEAGIPAADIQSEGLSFTQPRVKERTKTDQAINRRVEIDIKTRSEDVEIRPKETTVVE
ncbi:MAG: OmpA family protein [Geothrix sp.]|uniref:OmpA family protein n=1 Tax=Geothrix sp. TaxID=1962974 RepID=UPI003BAE94D5